MDHAAKKEANGWLVSEFKRDFIVALNRIFEQQVNAGHASEFKFAGPEGRFTFAIAAHPSARAGGAKLDERLFVRLDSYTDQLSSTTKIAIKKSGHIFVGDLVRQSYQELLRGKLNGKALGQISGLITEPLGFHTLTEKDLEPVDLGEAYDEERLRRLKPIEIKNAAGLSVTLPEWDRSKIEREKVLNVLKEAAGRSFAVTDGNNPNVAIVDMSPSRG